MDQRKCRWAIWGLFSIYSFFLLGNLLIFRLITLLRVGFNSYYYNDDGFREGYINMESLLQNVNFIPFKTIWLFMIHYHEQYFNFYTLFYNIMLNIAAFIPLGLFLPMLFLRMERFRSFVMATSSSFLLIEILQLFLHLGQFDIDDIMLNSLGGILGFSLLRFMLLKKWVIPLWK